MGCDHDWLIEGKEVVFDVTSSPGSGQYTDP